MPINRKQQKRINKIAKVEIKYADGTYEPFRVGEPYIDKPVWQINAWDRKILRLERIAYNKPASVVNLAPVFKKVQLEELETL